MQHIEFMKKRKRKGKKKEKEQEARKRVRKEEQREIGEEQYLNQYFGHKHEVHVVCYDHRIAHAGCITPHHLNFPWLTASC